MSQEIIEKTFNVDTLAKLTLSNIRGSVKILPGEDNTVKVTALKHQKSGDSERTEITLTQMGANHISVKTNYPDGWFGFPSRKPCKVEYTVQVPKECSLMVSGVSNSTAIQGVEGEMDIKSVSGQISLKDISGLLKINSVSGKVYGERLTGSLEFKTVSGKVQLDESHFPYIEGQTVSGIVKIQTPLLKGSYQFKSVSGDVELFIPPETACTAITNSFSGRIKTRLPTTSSHINGGNSRLEIHGGGVEVRSKSVSGSLVLKPYKESHIDGINKPASLEPPMHSVSTDTISPAEGHMELLERIANGELSVDEALEKI
jgi:DUF4097 and DUF4098 domain-containing protein YvlB